MEEKCVHIYYSGIVQGVGFRYRTQSIGRLCKVFGWVRNLPDGRVEVVAVAQKSVLEEFIERLDADMAEYIRNKDLFWEDPQGNMTDFTVRF